MVKTEKRYEPLFLRSGQPDCEAAVKAERERIVAALGRVMVFESCGGYGCAGERREDWDTVLAVVRNEPQT